METLLEIDYYIDILQKLAETAPDHMDSVEWFKEKANKNLKKYIVNLQYLEQKGLVISHIIRSVDGKYSCAFPPELTADGWDYISQEGGVRANIDTITVKIHENTLAQLIYAINQSQNTDQSLKDKLISDLKSLPGKTIASLSTKLICAALSHPAELTSLLQSVSHHHGT